MLHSWRKRQGEAREGKRLLKKGAPSLLHLVFTFHLGRVFLKFSVHHNEAERGGRRRSGRKDVFACQDMRLSFLGGRCNFSLPGRPEYYTHVIVQNINKVSFSWRRQAALKQGATLSPSQGCLLVNGYSLFKTGICNYHQEAPPSWTAFISM